MKRFNQLVTGLGLFCGAATLSHAALVAESTFNAGTAEGWAASGDFDQNFAFYKSTGGVPTTGGHIQVRDLSQGSTMYFLAPSAFEGDQSAAYGGSLSFNLATWGPYNNPFDGSDVILRSGSTYLTYDFSRPNFGGWNFYDISLVESNWHVGELSGAVASTNLFKSVLSNLSSLEIRAEYQVGTDYAGLDNVRLVTPDSSVPEPTSIALIGLGLAGLGAMRRRKQ